MLLLLKNELKGELNELDELMDLVVEMLVWLRSGWNFTTKCCWLKELWMMMRNEWWMIWWGMNGWMIWWEWIELNWMEWNGCVLLERWLLCWVWVEEELLKIYIFFFGEGKIKKICWGSCCWGGCWLLVVVCWLLVAILKMEK